MTRPTRTSTIDHLQSIVETDRATWKSGAFTRAIDTALTAFAKARPLVQIDNITLSAGRGVYPVPADLIRHIGSDWGCLDTPLQPYDAGYPGARPRITTIRQATGMALQFSPPPTSRHISAYGNYYEFYYAVPHVLSDDDCSITDDDYPTFIIRALAALMHELVAANVTKPITLHRGVANVPSASLPSAAYAILMDAYREAIDP